MYASLPSEVGEVPHLVQTGLVEGTSIHIHSMAVLCSPLGQTFIVLRQQGGREGGRKRRINDSKGWRKSKMYIHRHVTLLLAVASLPTLASHDLLYHSSFKI